MLQLSYLGIAFAAVFYLVFGITVRLMAISSNTRNKLRLGILITSFSLVAVFSLFAGLLNLNSGRLFLGVLLFLLSFGAFFVLAAIFVELHQIKTKVKMQQDTYILYIAGALSTGAGVLLFVLQTNICSHLWEFPNTSCMATVPKKISLIS